LKRLRIPDPILILAFCGFFFLWRLAAFGLIGADEPRYAQVAREMLARHDWVTPTLSGVAWLEKPPLYYWQAMLAYKIFGVSDWSARLPSVLDATVLVFVAYWFLRRFRPGSALDGALMLITSAGLVGYARAASMDMPLAATFGIAMLSWFGWFESGDRRLLIAFYVALALGMLAKGPVAPFLAAVLILIFSATQRSFKIVLKSLSVPGIVACLVVGLPWYVLVQLRNPQFFRVFLLEHNLARFGTNMFHHPEPFWYYIPVTLLGWVPWVVFSLVAIVWALRRVRDRNADSLNTFLLIWMAVVVVFFSISKSKLPGYILPAIAPGILLLGNYLQEKKSTRIHLTTSVLHGCVVAAMVFAALILSSILVLHRIVLDHATIAAFAIALGAAIGAILVIRKANWAGLHLAGIAPAIVVVAVTLRSGAPVLDQTLSARPVARELARLSHEQLPVVALAPRELEYGLQFYRNQPITHFELGQAPVGEHLVVAPAGALHYLQRNVPGRQVVLLGNFPPQKAEIFYVTR
jgi:4-amino-4-deoxy-L-arabinose transferase-like glycosyltransferase